MSPRWAHRWHCFGKLPDVAENGLTGTSSINSNKQKIVDLFKHDLLLAHRVVCGATRVWGANNVRFKHTICLSLILVWQHYTIVSCHITKQWVRFFRVTSGLVNPRSWCVFRFMCEHHFRGLNNPDVNWKRMHQLFCYMTLQVSLS